jgi:acylphosphatase
MEKRIIRRFNITGLVQGVCFRYFIEREATKLNITGYVQNTSTGGVIVYAQGGTDALDTLKRVCQKGPTAARVDSLTEEQLTSSVQWNEFTIKNTTEYV